jgi:hypothetical protein
MPRPIGQGIRDRTSIGLLVPARLVVPIVATQCPLLAYFTLRRSRRRSTLALCHGTVAICGPAGPRGRGAEVEPGLIELGTSGKGATSQGQDNRTRGVLPIFYGTLPLHLQLSFCAREKFPYHRVIIYHLASMYYWQ